MDLEEIEKLVNSDGQRIILVKDGKPTFVLLSFRDYQRGFAQKEESLPPEINERQSSLLGANELTLEDLPF